MKPEPQGVFPVVLLAEGKPCLVVGGGPIALRKVRALLNAQADITVICPDCVPELESLAREGIITCRRRRFTEGDVRDFYLVFAATNDSSVNRKVLEDSRNHRVYACSTDGQWNTGDFVTPAMFQRGDLTVAVSTGGASCRRSKLVKNSLARHVDMFDDASLLVLGVSHEGLSLAEREALDIDLEAIGARLMHVWGVHEFVLLSTCNRFELLAMATSDAVVESVLRTLMGFDHLAAESVYTYRGERAFSHLADVAAGLRSQVPGEHHIVAQVKDAIAYAVERQWAAGMMQQWVASALHIAKHIRQDTVKLLNACEIEELAVQYIVEHRQAGGEDHAVVVGSGTVGQSVVKGLLAHDMSITWCYHSTVPDVATDVADRLQVCPMEALATALAGASVVVSATTHDGYVLTSTTHDGAGGGRPCLLVDLAVPRDIDPALAATSEYIALVNLDDLKHWFRREKVDVKRIRDIVDRHVADHRESYEKLITSVQGGNAR